MSEGQISCMPKLAIETSKLAIQNIVMKIIPATRKVVLYTLETLHVCMPKVMLPAIQNSFLKNSHTNFQRFMGISSS
jgi:hypothetical protein